METKARASFAWGKLSSALKWMVTSGVVTYFLTELLKVVAEIDMDPQLLLTLNMFINSAIFAAAKFREGGEG